jgi:DnaK suppressor protein
MLVRGGVHVLVPLCQYVTRAGNQDGVHNGTDAPRPVAACCVTQETNMNGTTKRNAGLRQMLSERRREMQNEVQSRIRDGRTDRPIEVCDDLEHSDGDIQEDLELALLQMRAETLARIDEALARLDAGKYGSCFECDSEIAERRLRALPFAVRCQACEERREEEQGHARRLAQRRGSFSLFSDMVSS